MTNKKILVVEDDEAILEMLQLFLTEEGFEVETSPDGQVLQHSPILQADLILLDVFLPLLNGIELNQQLKANEATRHIPVILFSATNILKQANTSQVEAFIAKPFELDQLLALINKLLSFRIRHAIG